MNAVPDSANRPLRIIRAACLFGIAEIVAMLLLIAVHPLNMQRTSITDRVIGFAIVAFPYACLFGCTKLVREQRVLSWLLLVPTSLVLLVMTWGCLGEAIIADSAFRVEAAGNRYMNCGGTPMLFAIPLSYLISFGAFAVCAASFGVNRWLLRSPLLASPKETS